MCTYRTQMTKCRIRFSLHSPLGLPLELSTHYGVVIAGHCRSVTATTTVSKKLLPVLLSTRYSKVGQLSLSVTTRCPGLSSLTLRTFTTGSVAPVGSLRIYLSLLQHSKRWRITTK